MVMERHYGGGDVAAQGRSRHWLTDPPWWKSLLHSASSSVAVFWSSAPSSDLSHGRRTQVSQEDRQAGRQAGSREGSRGGLFKPSPPSQDLRHGSHCVADHIDEVQRSACRWHRPALLDCLTQARHGFRPHSLRLPTPPCHAHRRQQRIPSTLSAPRQPIPLDKACLYMRRTMSGHGASKWSKKL